MMKGNAFSDRVRLVTEWFQSWNNCEQTIALYWLLNKVTPTQARFLSQVLDHSLHNGLESAELAKLEKQANNATFLSSLHSQTEEQALSQLLTHMPLLNPGSTEARAEYMKLLPKVMLGSSEELDYMDQCRQLLSLALVHPAFPQDDREALNFWLSQLDRKQRNIVDRKAPSPTSSRIYQTQSTSEESGYITISGDLHSVLESNGFTDSNMPLQSGSQTLQHYVPSSIEDAPISYEEYVRTHMDKGIASMPPNSVKTAPVGHSTVEDPVNWKEGMKDVPLWLKSLRLHKYQNLFSDMEYEQMLGMTEDYLTEKGVTKGARTKIILMIRNLARRPETLVEIEQDMEKNGRLIFCISELRKMLLTPIKPYNRTSSPVIQKSIEPKTEPCGSGDEEEESKQHSSSDSELDELLAKDFPHEDLPSLITRAMGKAFSQLMGYTDTNEDNLGAFIRLLDAALQHEAFTVDQKNLFFDWKQQCTQTLRVLSPTKKGSRRGNFGGFHTIHTVPSAATQQSSRSKSRSLRTARIGVNAQAKGLSLPATSRASSTLPRMSARQLQQAPLPYHTPAFQRPKSLVQQFPSSPNGKGFPLASQTYNAPPPLPPRTRPEAVNSDSMYMNDLPQRVAEHALDDHSDN